MKLTNTMKSELRLRLSLGTPRPARFPPLCSSSARPAVARGDHLAVRRPGSPPQPLGALSASDTLGTFPRPPPGARRTPGARTSQPERYLSSPSGVLFSRGVRGISAEGKGDPPQQTAALACPLPRLHFKGKLLPDFPGCGTYRLCTDHGNAPAAAPRSPRLPAPRSPRWRPSAPRAPRRRGAAAAAVAGEAAAMAQGPRAQSHGAWLRAAGQDRGS